MINKSTAAILFVVTSLAIVVVACGKSDSDSKTKPPRSNPPSWNPTPQSPAPVPSPEENGTTEVSTDVSLEVYTYGTYGRKCYGSNKNYLGQCGYIEDKSLCDIDVSSVVDVRGATFKNVDFCGKDFTGVDFANVRIEDSTFEKVDLTRTNFDGANIKSTTFTETIFEDSFFVGVYFSGNVLKDNDYSGAVFRGLGGVESKAGYTTTSFSSSNTIEGGYYDSHSILPDDEESLRTDSKIRFKHSKSGSLISYYPLDGRSYEQLDIKVSRSGSTKFSENEFPLVVDAFRQFSYFSNKITKDSTHLFEKIFGTHGMATLPSRIDQGLSHLYLDTSSVNKGAVAFNKAGSQLFVYANSIPKRTHPLISTVGKFEFNGLTVKLDSLDIYPIAIASSRFFDSNSYWVGSRMSTLLHESWHSRCSIELSEDEVWTIIDTKREDLRTLDDKYLACFNSHVKCTHNPDLKELKDSYACDKHAYGAYGIEWVMLDYIADSCADCTETQRQMAKANSISELSRVEKASQMTNSTNPNFDFKMLKNP